MPAPIPGVPGWFATKRGKIISERKYGGGTHEIRGHVNHDGYRMSLWRCRARGIIKHVWFSHAIWTAFNGPIPKGLEIDHKNRKPADNRLCNLRVVTRSINMVNRKPWGRTGFANVATTPSGKFQAYVRRNGVKRYIGTFPSIKSAIRAQKAA